MKQNEKLQTKQKPRKHQLAIKRDHCIIITTWQMMQTYSLPSSLNWLRAELEKVPSSLKSFNTMNHFTEEKNNFGI